ncbi:trans-resveratrol di-O-methyltransferase-like isoform X2 [Iris pallida]|uniref:Trans-resveratrol di-O-methyltransferase-like isoform X2 n=1 Tax=Iris pallida TaxID=29817 RepID=A0AAX6H223_IRIPA|nr:trans-resveratrol di-O-methyltransferase-like isoform X2 [Iris pallida]
MRLNISPFTYSTFSFFSKASIIWGRSSTVHFTSGNASVIAKDSVPVASATSTKVLTPRNSSPQCSITAFVIEIESLPRPSLTSLPNPGMVPVASQTNTWCAISKAIDGSSLLNHEHTDCHGRSSVSSRAISMNGAMDAHISFISGSELVVIAYASSFNSVAVVVKKPE